MHSVVFEAIITSNNVFVQKEKRTKKALTILESPVNITIRLHFLVHFLNNQINAYHSFLISSYYFISRICYCMFRTC